MMRYRKGRSVVTILHSAAKRRNISIFERVLVALELELTADEARTEFCFPSSIGSTFFKPGV